MPIGRLSRARLDTCHPDLIRFVEDLYESVPFDLVVLCGHRGQAAQDEAFKNRASKLQWPNSKHNSMPSRAVDIARYPVDWSDMQSFKDLRRYGLARAWALDIKIRIISWDWPHFELI